MDGARHFHAISKPQPHPIILAAPNPNRQKVSLDQKHHLQQTVKQMREENRGLQSIVKKQRETLRKQASRQEKIAHAIQLLDRDSNSASFAPTARPPSELATLDVLEGGPTSIDDDDGEGREIEDEGANLQAAGDLDTPHDGGAKKRLPRPASATALVRNIGSPMQEGNAEGRIVHNAMAALMQKRAEDAREIMRLKSKVSAMKATMHVQEKSIDKLQGSLEETKEKLEVTLRESKKKVQTARSTVIGDLFKQGRLDSVSQFRTQKSILPHTFALESEASATLTEATAKSPPSREHRRRQSKLGELSTFRMLVNDELRAQNVDGMVDVSLFCCSISPPACCCDAHLAS